MNINWFPGHMKKATEEIRRLLPLVDLCCEVVDARIPNASSNRMLQEATSGKPHLIILNKSDLADASGTREWIEYWEAKGARAMAFQAQTDRKNEAVYREARALLAEEFARRKRRGIQKQEIRMMVFGIPNSGKSTFINNLAGRRSAKVGNRPGVTTQKQWIKTKTSLLLLDTPGILWPKLEETQALHLAYTGAIRDEILPIEELGFSLLCDLLASYEPAVCARYALEEGMEPLAAMEAIGEKIGARLRGGEIDYRRVAQTILDDFRKLRLGRITLERPPKEVCHEA